MMPLRKRPTIMGSIIPEILVRHDRRGQEFVSEKRRRQIRLVYDLVLNIAVLLFGVVGLVYVGYHYFTPALRNQPFESMFENMVGHTGTLIIYLAFSLLMLLAGVFFSLKTIRLMHNKAYLEAEEPPFADYR